MRRAKLDTILLILYAFVILQISKTHLGIVYFCTRKQRQDPKAINKNLQNKNMKKVNEVFFGEHGLTSTSANHLANIAQEKIVSNEAKLKNLEQRQKYRSEMEEYTIRFRELNARFKEWKIKECKRISQLKIIIPLELQTIYDSLCELEK